MSRHIPIFLLENIDYDAPLCGYREMDDSVDTFMKSYQTVKHAPYQKGDKTTANFWNHQYPDFRQVIVLEVRSEEDNVGEFHPRYVVQFKTKSGKWSRSYKIITPGDIYRGHFNDCGDLLAGMVDEMAEAQAKQVPYIEETVITTNYKYNPKYGNDRQCTCGHVYYRHFDSYENMDAVGCKYCSCVKFEEMVLLKLPHTPTSNPSEFLEADLLRKATLAGNRAFLDQKDGVMCGGAYITLWDYNDSFVKWLKKRHPNMITKLHKKGYTLTSLSDVWNGYRGQSADRYEAGANAFAAVLEDVGINCSVTAYLT